MNKENGEHTLVGRAADRAVWLDGYPLDNHATMQYQRLFGLPIRSPDGFNWGYGGSGPAQLSFAIALSLTHGRVTRPLVEDILKNVVTQLPQRADFAVKFNWPNTAAHPIETIY